MLEPRLITPTLLIILTLFSACLAPDVTHDTNLQTDSTLLFDSASAEDMAWRNQYKPHAVKWARDMITVYAGDGRPLTEEETATARKVGVSHPETVRVVMIDRIPLPEAGPFAEAINPFGVISENVSGLTVGPIIFIDGSGKLPFPFATILQHELVHVAQYEKLGLDKLYSEYLLALRVVGPRAIPLELEAYEKQSW